MIPVNAAYVILTHVTQLINCAKSRYKFGLIYLKIYSIEYKYLQPPVALPAPDD